jgi:hypothetical protein
MTLILIRASEQFVSQAVDRLITTDVGDEFDARSNKNIVYACKDGIVSIVYTGIAFLGSIPTDQWLVEQITGLKFDRDGKSPAVGLGHSWEPTEGLGQTMQRVQSALQDAVKSIPAKWKAAWKKRTFDLLAAGWKWNKRGRARPIVAGVSKVSDEDDFRVSYSDRFWHHRRSLRVPFVVGAVPSSNYSPSDLEQLRLRVTNKTWQEVECVMVEEVRRVAETNPYVGKHVLTVTLSPPKDAQGFITDHPLEPIIHPIRSSFVPDLKAEVHLSPWLVGKNLIQPPALLSHMEKAQLGDYTLTLSGPNKAGPMFFGSLQRPALK